MGCGCSCCKKDPGYENGTPLVSGGTVTPCFSGGRLFKIEKGGKWYYYNDTQDSKMTISAEFGPGSQIVPGKSVHVVKTEGNGFCAITADILPLNTCELCKVKAVNGYKVKPCMTYFSEAEQRKMREEAREKASKELKVMRELVIKKDCTNEHLLLSKARSAGQNFVDAFFPPTDQSLYRPGIDKVPVGTLRDLSPFAWRRPEDYLPDSWKDRIKIYESIKPSDIDQGLLGDCYFLCSCSALAEHPDHIKGIFKNDHCCCTERSEHKYGGWRVNLNIHGWWRTIIIDSYLPSKSLLPSFARNRHHPNELWISFIEKAYAKAYGSYQAIVAGYPHQALEDLTGFPAFCFDEQWDKATKDSKDREVLFTQLQDWNDDDYLLSLSTPSPGGSSPQLRGLTAASAEALFSRIGLGTGHAYSVLDVKHFPLHGLCMMKIRNPWGNGVEWTGDWSDDSPLWKQYPIIKLACKPEKKEDGIFWMEWKDVMKYFDSGSVCFRKGSWHSTWHDYRVPGCFSHLIPDTAFEIIVGNTEFKAFFTLYQKDKRGLPESDHDSKYAAIMLSLAKGDVEGKRLEVVANSANNPKVPNQNYLFQVARSVSLYYTLEKNSRYLVIPRRMQSATGSNTATKRFILGMIADAEVTGSRIKVNIVKLDDHCKVFDNLTAFDSGSLVSVKTVYQVKHGNDVFKTKKGSSLSKGSTEKSAKYENMM